MKFFKEELIKKIEQKAGSSKALLWLNIITFAESSFFPIPPDPFQIVLTLARPEKWLKFVKNVVIYSVLGGIFGYIIGFYFFDFFGNKLINFYNLNDEFEKISFVFKETTFWSIFIAALTPIPYKIFTISAGLFNVNIILFFTASVLGRGIRFFTVGALARYLGKRHAKKILKHLDIISIGLVLMIIVYFITKF